jgi:hypothetical protein
MNKDGVEEGEASNTKAYVKQHKNPLFRFRTWQAKADTDVPVSAFAR